jgi:hypothetical protein
VRVDSETPLTSADVQAIMEALFDIRSGVNYIVAVVSEEDDGPGEAEED